MNFQGYRRPDGNAGTRNYVLVIPSVGCSQGVAQAIAQGFKNVVYLPNILGCGQVGEDRMLVKKTLVGFGTHPNVFAVLIVGNGCEQLSPEEIEKGIIPTGKRVEVIVIQDIGGTRKTIALGKRIVKEMREDAARIYREKDEALSKSYRPYYKHTSPRRIEPGRIYEYDIELWPTCNLFRKGHRLRLDLACGDSNAFDFGGHYYGLKVGRDTIYHEEDHTSHLILPVIPRK